MPIILGGTDKEDLGSKPAQANSSSRPYVEKPFTKIGLVEWLEVNALCSSLSTTKKKKGKFGTEREFSTYPTICKVYFHKDD
jgi:hypothetical protein